MVLPLIVHASRRAGVTWETIAAVLETTPDQAEAEYGEPEGTS